MEHRPTCSAVIGLTVGAYGFDRVTCRQSRYVTTYVTRGNVRVGYCRVPGHRANVEARFGVAQPDPEWPGDLPDHPADATYEMPEGADIVRWGP